MKGATKHCRDDSRRTQTRVQVDYVSTVKKQHPPALSSQVGYRLNFFKLKNDNIFIIFYIFSTFENFCSKKVCFFSVFQCILVKSCKKLPWLVGASTSKVLIRDLIGEILSFQKTPFLRVGLTGIRQGTVFTLALESRELSGDFYRFLQILVILRYFGVFQAILRYSGVFLCVLLSLQAETTRRHTAERLSDCKTTQKPVAHDPAASYNTPSSQLQQPRALILC